MDIHPTDPTSLVAGLFFGLAGLAIFANQQWDDLDVTAFTAAGVMVIGLLLAGYVITSYLRTEAHTNVPRGPSGEDELPGSTTDS